MKKISLAKTLTLFGTTVLMIGTMAGCGKAASEQNVEEPTVAVIENEAIAKADSFAEAPVFESIKDDNNTVDLQKYEDPNGWSVTYNDADIDVTTQDNMVGFVYTSLSAGTNMVLVTYDVDMKAKEAVEKMAASWGNNTAVTESIFPGAEDVTGYWAMLQPSAEGSGYYEQAIARDYMDGYLLFDIIGHNSGDDEMDMAVSDSLAMIIDSITFNS